MTPRLGSIYPRRSATACGREKRALGDALGSAIRRQSRHARARSWSSQRHWHANEDEFVYVLEGEATLITDAGETVLGPGMAAGFRRAARRPSSGQSQRAARALSRSRHAREAEEAQYSDIDMMARKTVGASSSRARTASPAMSFGARAKAPCSRHRALSLDALAAARRQLPASAELLGLCARGHRHERRVEGRLARAGEALPLPSLGQPRLRPGARSQRRASPVRALALRQVAVPS